MRSLPQHMPRRCVRRVVGCTTVSERSIPVESQVPNTHSYMHIHMQAKELRQQIQCMHGECSKLISTTIQAFKTDLLTPYIREAHLQVGTGFVTPKQAIDSLQTQC